MRDITAKADYLKKIESSLHNNLDQKCHNVLVDLEEQMLERIEKGDTSLTFYIKDKSWYDYMHNSRQHTIMRDWISRQYECLGWSTRWWQDDGAIDCEWYVILS